MNQVYQSHIIQPFWFVLLGWLSYGGEGNGHLVSKIQPKWILSGTQHHNNQQKQQQHYGIYYFRFQEINLI
jgi:hypothetical protein